WDQYRNLIDKIEAMPEEPEAETDMKGFHQPLGVDPANQTIGEMRATAKSMEQRLALYKSQIDPLRPQYQKQQHILNIFQDHKLAVERKRLHAALQKEMADEADK